MSQYGSDDSVVRHPASKVQAGQSPTTINHGLTFWGEIVQPFLVLMSALGVTFTRMKPGARSMRVEELALTSTFLWT